MGVENFLCSKRLSNVPAVFSASPLLGTSLPTTSWRSSVLLTKLLLHSTLLQLLLTLNSANHWKTRIKSVMTGLNCQSKLLPLKSVLVMEQESTCIRLSRLNALLLIVKMTIGASLFHHTLMVANGSLIMINTCAISHLSR